MNILELAKSILPENSELIYLSHFGSKLYGTDRENSDTDIKGIYVSSLESLILKKDKNQVTYTSGKKNEKNSKDDIDITLYSLHYFLELLQKGETGALDLLFSMYRKETIVYSQNINYIKNNKNLLISKNSHAFVGYALGQASKYGIKGSRLGDIMRFRKALDSLNDIMEINTYNLELSEFKYIQYQEKDGIKYLSVLGKLFAPHFTVKYIKERCDSIINSYGDRSKDSLQGVDWKALSHALRVILEMKELAENKFITFPLPDAMFIKNIKSGNETLEVVLDKIRNGIDEIEILLESSDLPENVDNKTVEDIIILYTKINFAC